MRNPRSLLLIIGAIAISAVWIARGGADNLDRPVLGASTPDAERWLWARQGGGEGWTYGTAIDRTPSGEIIAAGFMDSRAAFGRTTLRVRGGLNGLLAKYSSHGDLRRMWQLGDQGAVAASGVAYRQEGIMLMGQIRARGMTVPEPGRMQFGNSELEHQREAQDAWLALLSPVAGPLWARQFHGIGEEELAHEGQVVPRGIEANGLAVGEDGGIYVGGGFTGLLTPDGPENVGEPNSFLAKLTGAGEFEWIRTAGGEGRSRVRGLTASADGGVFAVGSFVREARFDEVVVRSLPGEQRGDVDLTSAWDFFVAKYAADGALEWVRSGRTIGTNPHVVAKYSVDGALEWVPAERSSGGDPSAFSRGSVARGIHQGSSIAYSVAELPDGRVVVGGGFEGRIEFAGSEYIGMPEPDEGQILDDTFVAAFDREGEELWMATGGGPYGDFHRSIATDHLGNVYATGSFMTSARFGQFELSGPADEGDWRPRHVYVVKYDREGREQWAVQSYSEAGLSSGTAITVSEDGTCYLTGFFDGSADFGRHRMRGLRSRNMFVAALDCNK